MPHLGHSGLLREHEPLDKVKERQIEQASSVITGEIVKA